LENQKLTLRFRYETSVWGFTSAANILKKTGWTNTLENTQTPD